MNLIEQLGGYENSQGIREAYIKNGWSLGDVAKGFHMAFTLQDLDNELLEHRRQHGIFEIGDRVVYSAKFCDESENNGFGEITYSTKDLSVFEIDNYYLVSADEIHHATPEEIAAGHRID